MRQWESRWPRPSTKSAYASTLAISAAATVDVRSWSRLHDEGEAKSDSEVLLCGWYKDIQDIVSDEKLVGLADMFLHHSIMHTSEGKPLWSQLARHIATRAELQILRTKGASPSHWILQGRLVEESGSWSAREVDQCCLQFVAASREATTGHRHAGLAVDKYLGRGVGIQNGLMVLPNNVGFEFVPQVDRDK